MQKLIFDIETYGPEFSELPGEIQEYLLEKFSNDFKEKSREELIEIINERISLLPQLSEIIAISFYNPDTQRGAVYFQSKDEIEDWSDNLIDFKRFTSEEELIKKFWEIVPNYQEIITFNGNKFDIPFLLFRSLKHKIRPTYSLLDKEYHIDLYEKLSFNSRIQKVSLKLAALSLGLEDPKEKFDGKKVRELIKNKDYKSLAYYALGDVLTTAKLYELWTNYLRYF
jgi:DNA polymerase elongation subunit (family B)